MKWSKKKTKMYSLSYSKTGRKKGYKASVIYNDYYEIFYFSTEKDGKSYNSCWDKLEFKTEEECMVACEKWIDEN